MPKPKKTTKNAKRKAKALTKTSASVKTEKEDMEENEEKRFFLSPGLFVLIAFLAMVTIPNPFGQFIVQLIGRTIYFAWWTERTFELLLVSAWVFLFFKLTQFLTHHFFVYDRELKVFGRSFRASRSILVIPLGLAVMLFYTLAKYWLELCISGGLIY